MGSVSKYRNVRTKGYHSKREANRAMQLSLMQSAGQIRNLREQVPFLLIPKQDGERSCSYIADFTYEQWTADGWVEVVEDSKGYRDAVYKIKRKLMRFALGIRILET